MTPQSRDGRASTPRPSIAGSCEPVRRRAPRASEPRSSCKTGDHARVVVPAQSACRDRADSRRSASRMASPTATALGSSRARRRPPRREERRAPEVVPAEPHVADTYERAHGQRPRTSKVVRPARLLQGRGRRSTNRRATSSGWLAGYFAADGCVAKDGTVMLNSASSRRPRVRPRCSARGSASVPTASPTQTPTRHRRASESSFIRIHFINEDLIEDFFLLAEHRRRFVGCARRRGHAADGSCSRSEPTDRVEEVFCAVVPRRRTPSRSRTTSSRATASVARRAATRSRSCARSSTSTSSTRSSGSRRVPASRCATTTRSFSKDRQRKQRLHEAVGAAIDFYHRPAARVARRRQRAPLPAQPRLRRRRRRASSQLGLVARRLGRAQRAPPAARSSRATTSSTPASRS